METITGFVEHIVYRNEENGYTVLNLASNEEDEVTCVGVFQMISEGESLELTGEYTVHPSYGPQFKVLPALLRHCHQGDGSVCRDDHQRPGTLCQRRHRAA